jgi:uncharacterized delta-60 repeat protein
MGRFVSLKTQPGRPSHRVPSSFRPSLEALEDRCLLSGTGSLDTSFGSGGIVTTSLSNLADYGTAVLIQPWDGKIVAAGSTTVTTGHGNHTTQTIVMSLVRYTTTGSPDRSFGVNGQVVSNIAGGIGVSGGAALYPQSGTANDGKIVVAEQNSNSSSQVARFNPNGSLDTSFNSHGKSPGSVTMPFAVGLQCVVVQPWDGKIVVAGYDSQATEFELTRFNADGSLDRTFGSGGTATLARSLGSPAFANVDEWDPLGLQADGKLVVAGRTGSPAVWEVARFNANGTLDTTFNSAGPQPGTVTTSFPPYNDMVRGLAIYPNTGTDTADAGKIIVVGNETPNPIAGPSQGFALARYNTNGTPDTSFGTSGSGQVLTLYTYGAAKAVAVQTDGKLVVAAQTSDASGNIIRWSLARYNTDGSLDTSFGTSGYVQTVSGTADPASTVDWAIAIQADGKIVTAGWVPSGTELDFMVARYINQPLIGSFTASANPVSAGSAMTLTAAGVTGSGTITQVAFYAQLNGTNTLLGYGTQTNPGVWTFTFTVTLTPGTYTLSAVAEASYGLFSDPFVLSLTVQ